MIRGDGGSSTIPLLFCLPCAGGGANIYSTWSTALALTARVRPVSLPGREKLIGESPLRDCSSLIARLLPDITPQLDRPYAIFGHSMGALVGFELACALREAGYPEPTCLLLSGYPAATFIRPQTKIHEAPEDVVIEAIRGFGGVPDELLNSDQYRDFMLPLMRADLAVIETYHYTPRPPLTCPVVVVGGEQDQVCLPEQLDGWRAHTTGRYSRRLFPGGHFHMFEQRERFVDFLRQTLAM